MDAEPDQPGGFPSTSWTAVIRAGGAGTEEARQAMETVLRRYVPALRCYLVQHRHVLAERADDLLQGFITSRILEHRLISQADPQRGRFRNLLLASLNNYITNCMRDEHRAKRHPGGLQPLDESCEVSADEDQPGDAFDAAWARGVIGEALLRMERECRQGGREPLWLLFQGRVVAPALEGAPPCSYETLVAAHGFQTPSQATNALVTAKRLFARILRNVVAEYADDPQSVEQEIRDFAQIFARARRVGPSAV